MTEPDAARTAGEPAVAIVADGSGPWPMRRRPSSPTP